MAGTAPQIDPDRLLGDAPRLRALARRLALDEHAAEDVLQETFLASVVRPPALDRPVGPWLARVARNFALKMRRGDGRRRRRESAAPPPREAEDPADAVARTEILRQVVDEVLALEPIYRDAVIARFFDELDLAATAARLDVPVETARTRIKRALAILRDRLDRRHGGRAAWGALVLADRHPLRTATAAAAAAGGLLLWTKAVAVGGAAAVLVGGLTWWALATVADPGSGPATTDTATADRADGPSRRAAAAAIAEPPSPSPDEVVFAGRVVDGDGRPVAGATVTATVFRPSDDVGRTPPREASATARDGGAFEVRLPKGTTAADVIAAAPGFAVVGIDRVPAGTPVEVRLVREGVLSGRVVDEAGAPVAGAVVRMFRVVGTEHVDAVSVTTGRDGAFRIGGFDRTSGEAPPMRVPVLDVRASGRGGVQQYGPFPAAGEEMRRDVVLFPERALVVRVCDGESGAPVAGATVSVGRAGGALRIDAPHVSTRMLAHPAPTFDAGDTDERGLCTLRGVPAEIAPHETLFLRAARTGFVRAFASVDSRPPGDEEPVEIRLHRAVTVRGRVVDTEGAPVAGASVYAEPRTGYGLPTPPANEPWHGTVRTDAEGRYALPGVRASTDGSLWANICTGGSRLPRADGNVVFTPGQQSVRIHAKAGEDFVAPDIVLGVPRQVRSAHFVVVDEAGRPVADAVLESNSCEWNPRTDAAGRATLHWPAEEDLVEFRRDLDHKVARVVMFARGHARRVVETRPDSREPPEVRVVLSAARRLVGRVREGDGRPVPGAQVQVTLGDDPTRLHVRAVSAADGSFAVEDLPAAECRVMALAGGRGWTDAATATPGEGPVDLVMPPDRHPRGTLVVALESAEEGTPVVDARVHVRCEPELPGDRAPREAPGIETFRDVPAGTWRLYAAAPGRVAIEAEATVRGSETTRVRVALARGAVRTIRLVGDEGLAEVRRRSGTLFAVRIDAAPGEPGAGARLHASPDEDLLERFDGLQPGRHVLQIESDDWGFGSNDDKVPVCYVSAAPLEAPTPGRTSRETRVEMVRGGYLDVTLDDPEAPEHTHDASRTAPPVGFLEILTPGGDRRGVTPWRWRGGLGSTPLAPGEYIVRVSLPSGRVRESGATVRVGERTIVTFGPP